MAIYRQGTEISGGGAASVTKTSVDTALGTAAADDTYFYRGDGTWAAAGSASVTKTNVDTALGTGDADDTYFYRGDGTWALPTDTTYTAGTGLTLTGTAFSLTTPITVTSTSVSDGTNTFSKYTLPDLAVSDFGDSAIAISTETTLDNDTTLPTTAWVKDQGYLTSSGITVTSSSVSDGTNTFNKYVLPALTTADLAGSALSTTSELTDDSDTTIPTTGWVKDQGYLTSSGITVTSTSVSDGTNTFNKAVPRTDEEIEDLAGGMFTGNTETGITATYQDSDGTVDLVTTLQSVGTGLNLTNGQITTELPAPPTKNLAVAQVTTITYTGAGDTSLPANWVLTFTDTDNSTSDSTIYQIQSTDSNNDVASGMATAINNDSGAFVSATSSDNVITVTWDNKGAVTESNGTGVLSSSNISPTIATSTAGADSDADQSYLLLFDQSASGFDWNSDPIFPSFTIDATSDPLFKFISNESAGNGNEVGELDFQGYITSGSSPVTLASIKTVLNDSGNLSTGSSFDFQVYDSGTLSSVLTIDGDNSKVHVKKDLEVDGDTITFDGLSGLPADSSAADKDITIDHNGQLFVADRVSTSDLTVSNLSADTLSTSSETSDDSDTTIPTTAWVKDQGFLTDNGITITSTSVTDGTNTLNAVSTTTEQDITGSKTFSANSSGDGYILKFEQNGSSNTLGNITFYDGNSNTNANRRGILRMNGSATNNGTFVIFTAQSGSLGQRLSISHENMTLNQDLILGNNSLYVGGTQSNNEFDDYEEGTWIPVLNVSRTLNSGSVTADYTKIGNKVILDFEATYTITSSTVDFTIQSSSLPFAPSKYAVGTASLSSVNGFSLFDSSNNIKLEDESGDPYQHNEIGFVSFIITYETTS